jgi:DNA (cytosine-5)-methyltransferase 1
MFNLGVFRHRYFEVSPESIFALTPPCQHDFVPFLMQQAGSNSRKLNRVKRHPGRTGIDWMTQDELANAIPPAYSEFIGREVLKYLTQGVR